MAKVIVAERLKSIILKRFKGEANDVFDLMKTLEKSPLKGKVIGQAGGVLIKELKYRKFRFYFTVDGYRIKFWDIDDLSNLIIRFVRMSDKKSQQKVIEEIKIVLRKFGEERF